MSNAIKNPVTKAKPAFPTKGCGLRGAKKARHERKGSGTSGRTKAASCKAKWLHRFACRKARSYRDPMYPSIMRAIDKKAGRHVPTETQGRGKRANLLYLDQAAAA